MALGVTKAVITSQEQLYILFLLPPEAALPGHGPGLGAVLEGVAALAVDLAVRALAHVGGVQLLVAFDAAEAVLVVVAEAGHHPFGLKDLEMKMLTYLLFLCFDPHLSAAPWAAGLLPRGALDGLNVHPPLVVGLHAVPELLGVAQLTVDLEFT